MHRPLRCARIGFPRSPFFGATLFGMLACLSIAAPAAEPTGPIWNVIGRQGIVSLVLVPAAEEADVKAYERQIDHLRQPAQSCFINFYTNSRGVAITVPLPDEVTNEATAMFRRSTKQGAEMFTWSCRLKIPANNCF